MINSQMKVSELDIRSYFAALAMQAKAPSWYVLQHKNDDMDHENIKKLAEVSVVIADALIAELNK